MVENRDLEDMGHFRVLYEWRTVAHRTVAHRTVAHWTVAHPEMSEADNSPHHR